MAILQFFQDGGRPPSCTGDARVQTTHDGHLVVVITVQNLAGIDAVASITWKEVTFGGGDETAPKKTPSKTPILGA